ncbi:MAG: hypothetical protein Q4G24_04790 [Paracoccus sp. (in: a-proteobacteria)]|uniref:hypothetical protein n=1 Tax=Paracoccus sp. TaxID=267 RepID=UPI0026E07446|nr:hypothetical protein [Paracoccus sp. (in: a-proteobacteria)]MDO5620769.1 hypothetical protein [Paracoccus sp. (in: a-proteobacteria)]
MEQISRPLTHPLALWLVRLTARIDARHQRPPRIAYDEIPEALRRDLGLDGGAPLHRDRPDARRF